MKLDAALAPANLRDVPAQAAAAEALGFDAVWTSETQHDPFLSLALVAEHASRLRFGTAVAIGFARSPTVLAHTAWDLAAASSGPALFASVNSVRHRSASAPASANSPSIGCNRKTTAR